MNMSTQEKKMCWNFRKFRKLLKTKKSQNFVFQVILARNLEFDFFLVGKSGTLNYENALFLERCHLF